MSEPEASGARMTRRRKLLFSSITLAIAVPLLGLAAEGVVRLRHRLKNGTFGRVYTYAVHEESGLKIPKPGTVFGPIRINSLGFRGPEIEIPKPPGRIRIAFLGGSTTYSAETSSEDATWPVRVRDLLAEAFPDVQFDIVNAGVGGFAVEHSHRNWTHRVRPLDPDVVVVYHATNDLCYDTRRIALERGLIEGKPDEESWLAEISLAWHLIEKNWQLYRRQSAARGDAPHLDYEPGTVSLGFQERLSSLLHDVKQTVPVVAVATFSHKVREEQTPNERLGACETSLFYMPYLTPESILMAFDDYNRAIRRDAAEQDVLLIGGEDSIPGDGRHFKDSVHFSDEGSRRMAERVARALADSPALRALAQEKKQGGE
ncbi:MAG: SGNH/GDSL hydrolase family protein [Planctomycetota bacterium]